MNSKWIGIPYVNQGRSFDGCDCWGIVDLYYREILGITLPDYLGAYRDAKETAIVEAAILYHKRYWQPTIVEPDSVALFRVAGKSCHVGVMLRDGEFLHTLVGRNSAVENIRDISWRDRFLGTWKWMAT